MLDKPNLDEYKQQVAEHFNARTNYDNELSYRRANRLVELAGLQKGQKILDVATGTGIVAINAAQIVGSEGKVIGVDISTVLLSQAQRKIEAANLQNIELQESDVEYLSFSDESFDAILCSSAIMCLGDIPAALHNWHRWLKKGGIVAFSAYDERSLMTPLITRICAKYGISLPNIQETFGTPEKCYNMLLCAGFQDIEVKTEQLGNYFSVSDTQKWWNGVSWLHPKGNPLLQLEPEQIERLKAEYDTEIEALATDKGVWRDITTFFVLALK